MEYTRFPSASAFKVAGIHAVSITVCGITGITKYFFYGKNVFFYGSLALPVLV